MRGVGLLDLFGTLVITMILIILVAIVTLLVPATGGARFTVDMSETDKVHEAALVGRPVNALFTVKQQGMFESSDERYSIAESFDRTGLTTASGIPPPPVTRVNVIIEPIRNFHRDSFPRGVHFRDDEDPEEYRMIRRLGSTAWQFQVNERMRVIVGYPDIEGVKYALE